MVGTPEDSGNGLRDQIKRVRIMNTSDADIATAFIGDGGSHVEADGFATGAAKGRDCAVRFVENSGRNSGPDGGTHRCADAARRGGAKIRQGLDGRLVRDARNDVGAGAGKRQERTAEHDQDVLHGQGSRGIHSVGAEGKMALVRQFCFDHGLPGSNTKSVDEVALAAQGKL